MADTATTVQVEPVPIEPLFTKEQILKSEKYRESVDLIGALLVDGQDYLLKEVDSLIQKFNKKEIKTC